MFNLSSDTEQYDYVGFKSCTESGHVLKYRRRSDSATVAIKIICRRFRSEALIAHEIQLLTKLAGENLEESNIVRLVEAFADRRHYYLVFEQLDTSIHRALHTRGLVRTLSVRDIRTITLQMLTALVKLNDAGIVHTGIDLKNVMFVDPRQQPFRVKLIDFRSALSVDELASMQGPHLQPRCYWAPEVLLGLPCCEKIDIWSLGCMMVEMYFGSPLFSAESELEVAYKIFKCRGMPSAHLINSSSKAKMFFCLVKDHSGNYQWKLYERLPWCVRQNLDTLPVISLDQLVMFEDPVPGLRGEHAARIADCQCMTDLLKRMLTVDPHRRISASQALRHPFLTLQHLRGPNSHRQYYEYSVQGYLEARVPYQDSMHEQHVLSQVTVSDHTQKEMEKEHTLSVIESSQKIIKQGYQEAVISEQPSWEEDAGCSFQPPSRSSATESQGSSVRSDGSPVDHNQELPKKKKKSSLRRSLLSLCTCFCVRRRKKRPVTSQSNDSQGGSGNTESPEDLADTDHTARDTVEEERQRSAADNRQKTFNLEAVIPEQPSREEVAGCSFQPPIRSSSRDPQVSSVPSLSSSLDSVPDLPQELPKKQRGFMRRWRVFSRFGVCRN